MSSKGLLKNYCPTWQTLTILKFTSTKNQKHDVQEAELQALFSPGANADLRVVHVLMGIATHQ